MAEQDDQPKQERPEIFAVEKDINGEWKFNRRGFLATMSTAAAAAAAVPLVTNASDQQQVMQQSRRLSLRRATTIQAHRNKVMALSIHPSGAIMASGSEDSTVKLWSMPDGALFNTLTDHSAPVHYLALCQKQGVLATGGTDQKVCVYVLPSGEEMNFECSHNAEISAVAINAEGSMLVTASKDGVIKLWTVPAGDLVATLTDHSASVNALAINEDGTLLVSGSQDGTVRLWTLPNAKLAATLDGYDPAEMWAVNATDQVNVRDSASMNASIIDQVSPGAMLQVVEAGAEWHKIVMDDGRTGYIAAWLTLPAGRSVNRLVISGNVLAAAGSGGIVRLWSLPDGDLIGDLNIGDAAGTLAVNPAGTVLAVAAKGGAISLWDLATQQKVGAAPGHTQWINELAFSPDGSLLASASNDRTIKLWTAPDGNLSATLEGHQDGVNTVLFTPDGEIVASGSSDYTIRLWDAARGQLLKSLVDLDINYDTVEGIIIEVPVTSTNLADIPAPAPDSSGGGSDTAPSLPPSGTFTFTLPCGSEIPPGAVCICNCVAGSIPSCDCVGYVAPTACPCDTYIAPTACTCHGVCSCDGDCSCNTVCSCVGNCTCNQVCTCDTVHYWYPN